MTVFLDSSALVKRYAEEPGADDVRSLENGVACAIARVEVPAAIWRKCRLGELHAEAAAVLVEQFEWEWFGDEDSEPLLAVVAVTDTVLDEAARACARHGLRAYDAVQLGAAIVARVADGGLTRFACFDRGLSDAALLEAFVVVP